MAWWLTYTNKYRTRYLLLNTSDARRGLAIQEFYWLWLSWLKFLVMFPGSCSGWWVIFNIRIIQQVKNRCWYALSMSQHVYFLCKAWMHAQHPKLHVVIKVGVNGDNNNTKHRNANYEGSMTPFWQLHNISSTSLSAKSTCAPCSFKNIIYFARSPVRQPLLMAKSRPHFLQLQMAAHDVACMVRILAAMTAS